MANQTNTPPNSPPNTRASTPANTTPSTSQNTTLIFMSNNTHKLHELQTLLSTQKSDFSKTNITIIPYTDVIRDLIDPEETGTTFEENAILKVQAFPNTPPPNNNTTFIVLSEDSGIVVDGLDGRPGIFSARYAGENATREQMCNKILTELGDNPVRSARFVAVMATRMPDGTIHAHKGEIEGHISTQMAGDYGFGYDPIFIPQGYTQTMGELGQTVKHQLSHRARAFKKVVAFLNA